MRPGTPGDAASTVPGEPSPVRWTTAFLDSPSRVAEPFWQAVTASGLSPRRGPDGAFATLLPPDGDAPQAESAELHVHLLQELGPSFNPSLSLEVQLDTLHIRQLALAAAP